MNKKEECLKLIDEVQNESTNIIQKSKENLIEYANGNPDILEFTRLILLENNYNHTEDEKISEQLQSLCYDLGYNLQRNSYHNCSILKDLKSFIGNYFLDDSAFRVEKNEFDGNVAIDDDIDGKQNPKILIDAAIENVKINEDFEKKLIARRVDFKQLLDEKN
ncbi:hypothetical protein M0R19_09195 [Candidatus Pacearchaeota archaeon]|jgi:hypothetical protein|nr:hypothetical protein [Candidatus Pacearchaeota archaeon]